MRRQPTFSYSIESLSSRTEDRLANCGGGPLFFPALLVDFIAQPPKGERFSEQDILDGPTLIRGLRITLDFSEGDLLGKARQRGTTFDRIAAALGLRSRQAAEQRYVKLYAGWDSPRATAAAHGATSEDSERSPLQRQAGRGGP